MDERQLIESIDWGVLPPSLNKVYAPIMSPKPGETIRGIIVASEFCGVKTHWMSKRTTGCIGKANGCEGCAGLKPARWKGYFGVLRPDTDRLWLAELTPRAYGDIASILATGTKGYRGWVLTLSRPGKHAAAQVRAALRPPTPEEKAVYLPGDFDVKRSLLLVWERLRGVPDIRPPQGEEENPE